MRNTKISDAQKLNWQNPEYRQHMSDAHKGQVPWNKGKKGLQVAWNKGEHCSDETKEKMRLAQLGKTPWNKGMVGVVKHSAEAINNMSVAAKKQVNNKGRFQPGRKNPLKGTGGNKQSWNAKYRSSKEGALSETRDLGEIDKFYVLARVITLSVGVKHVVDHINPLSKGGLHHQDNLQVITLSENSKKRDKYPFTVSKNHFPYGYDDDGDSILCCVECSYGDTTDSISFTGEQAYVTLV